MKKIILYQFFFIFFHYSVNAQTQNYLNNHLWIGENIEKKIILVLINDLNNYKKGTCKLVIKNKNLKKVNLLDGFCLIKKFSNNEILIFKKIRDMNGDKKHFKLYTKIQLKDEIIILNKFTKNIRLLDTFKKNEIKLKKRDINNLFMNYSNIDNSSILRLL